MRRCGSTPLSQLTTSLPPKTHTFPTAHLCPKTRPLCISRGEWEGVNTFGVKTLWSSSRRDGLIQRRLPMTFLSFRCEIVCVCVRERESAEREREGAEREREGADREREGAERERER